MTITNFESNVYDVAVVGFVLYATTSATKEGKKALSCIYKAINVSMDAKLNERVSVGEFLRLTGYNLFLPAADALFTANYLGSFGIFLWTIRFRLGAVSEGKIVKKAFFRLCNIFIHFFVPVHQCKRHVCGDFNSI